MLPARRLPGAQLPVRGGISTWPARDRRLRSAALTAPAPRVDIKIWSGGPNAGPNVAFVRQSLPPVIWDGRLNPALNNSSQWRFTLGNAVHVWRTGVGIDRRGNLIYPAANDQLMITLALTQPDAQGVARPTG